MYSLHGTEASPEANHALQNQYGWESIISGIPHWAAIVLDLGESAYLDAATNASEISNFTSTLDMKNGVLSWAYVWTPPDATSFNISYQLFAHKVNVNQAFVQLNVTAAEAANITIANVLNGDCAVRAQPADKGSDSGMIYSSVSPDGLDNITGVVYAGMAVSGAIASATMDNLKRPYVGNNESSIATGYSISLPAGQTVTFTKFVGVASSDGFEDPRETAKNAAMAANSTGYASALANHAAEWAVVLPAHAVDDFSDPTNGSLPDDPYAVESAILAVANPYYLLQNTVSENAMSAAGNASINSHSISVGGLGSDAYGGNIFWDAETWMQPGLVASFPYAARGISNYRMDKFSQAQENIATSYQSSKNDTTFSSDGAIFPWTSARPGNCTGMGPCWDYEYHINGDIAQALVNEWLVSGDTDFFQKNYLAAHEAIAVLLSEILQKNGSQWALTNMTDPDEFANHVDNGAFTMPLIANTLTNTNFFRGLFNSTPNDTWTSQAENVQIGRNEEANILLEYTGMPGNVSVKQADVVLVTYPLSYTGENYSDSDSLSDLDWYAAKQSQDGPGMTYAIFSIVANQVSPSGCAAYTYSLYSHMPYVRAPWFQFSEQLVDDYSITGFHPAYPFLTGHGGANQVVLFGYLGLRLLPTTFSLHINPSLPPQVPQVRYRTFYWHGWPISAFSNQTHTTLTRNSTLEGASGTSPNSTYATQPIPVIVGSPESTNTSTFSLPPNGTLTVPNRQYSLNKTTAGNALQCQFADSAAEIVPGQFAVAAVDGARSTKWQPDDATANASVSVEVPVEDRGKRVKEIRVDWAQRPAWNYSVSFSNDSSSNSGEGGEVAGAGEVKVSEPWDEAGQAEIRPVGMGNTTVVNGTGDLVLGRFVTLTVWGHRYDKNVTVENMQGEGATVAEWEIIVEEEGGGEGPVRMRERDEAQRVEVSGWERQMLERAGRDRMRRLSGRGW
jgi:trehalose/maltose hydrolase-like predicted phosphorylase